MIPSAPVAFGDGAGVLEPSPTGLAGLQEEPDGARSVVWVVCVLQLCSETELLGCVGWGFRC